MSSTKDKLPTHVEEALNVELKRPTRSKSLHPLNITMTLNFRLAADVIYLPHNAGYELITTWIANVAEQRGKETVIQEAYVKEYIHLGTDIATQQKVEGHAPESDTDSESDEWSDRFTAATETALYDSAFSQGYDITPVRCNYDQPVITVKLGKGGQYQQYVIYKRQPHDRIIVRSVTFIQDLEELKSLERDLEQMDMKLEGPTVEREIDSGEHQYLTLTLPHGRSFYSAPTLPGPFSATTENESLEWFVAILQLETACFRKDLSQRILQWLKPFETAAKKSPKLRQDHFKVFTSKIANARRDPQKQPEEYQRELLRAMGKFLKGKGDEKPLEWMN